ncbi:MAG TPA: hypothetical protein VMJ35_16015 [Dongiaceae bacterium]|nr:hypothetical protein [Dongiaceae bacterium]
MKLSKIATILFGAALLFSTGAMAGEPNKTNISLADKVTVEGKTLEPGTYKVEWTGNGPNVQVTVSKGKQQVATFPAQLTEQATTNSSSAYSTNASADGSKSLTAIYVGGKKAILQIEGTSASNPNTASQAK